MNESQSGIEPAVVVVPVHNEEPLLSSCLSAIANAMTQAPVPTELIIALDACTDASADIASRWAQEIGASIIELNRRNVGAARAAGFRSAAHAPRTWFATTDADSVVRPNWLVSQLAHAHRGAHVVAGTVVAEFDPGNQALKVAYEADYRSVAGHGHVHGANLGMRADAYWCVGGFGAVASDEDVDLVRRFADATIPVLYAADAPVTTSTRFFGRAPSGFAGHLRSLHLAAAQ